MRDKEAIETERKNLSRNMEKQAKVIEKLVESEKNLSTQVVSLGFSVVVDLYRFSTLKIDLEREVVVSGKALDFYKQKVASLEKESGEWQTRADGEKKRMAEVGTLLVHDRFLYLVQRFRPA
jgi:E3 ubiquitin-protein ligase BRE1